MITGLGREVLQTKAPRRGLHMITKDVEAVLGRLATEETRLVNLFVRHTSCGLTIQENADPSARHDLELFFERLVPFHQEGFQHVHEGPDDMPSHIKTVLMQTSLTIPCQGSKMLLGVWQGVYLWEHRDGCPTREIIISVS